MSGRRTSRLVSHRRSDALRSVDGGRCVQSVRVVLSHRPRRASAGCGRGSSARFASMGCRARCGPTTARRSRRPAPARLSHLAVWWLKLGIQLDRIDPGHPEQNGRHERFHLTLQQETTTPAGGDAAAAATPVRSDAARFNTERPHEALGPAAARAPLCAVAPALPRAARGPVVRRDAPGAAGEARRGRSSGRASWIFVSEAVRGELVGLAETERGDWTRSLHARRTRAHRSADAPVHAGWHGRRIG